LEGSETPVRMMDNHLGAHFGYEEEFTFSKL
jgi:hypothetical protein